MPPRPRRKPVGDGIHKGIRLREQVRREFRRHRSVVIKLADMLTADLRSPCYGPGPPSVSCAANWGDLETRLNGPVRERQETPDRPGRADGAGRRVDARYAGRDKTPLEHSCEIREALGYREFASAEQAAREFLEAGLDSSGAASGTRHRRRAAAASETAPSGWREKSANSGAGARVHAGAQATRRSRERSLLDFLCQPPARSALADATVSFQNRSSTAVLPNTRLKWSGTGQRSRARRFGPTRA